VEVLFVHAANLLRQHAIARKPRRQPRRVRFPRLVFVVLRRGDRQLRADRLDPVYVAMLVDELDHHFGRRSSSAWAKKADALRRISLARFNSRFSLQFLESVTLVAGQSCTPTPISFSLPNPFT
jgi:hypothetical protein